ncbi:MAG TPA: hypothetical protein VFQ22_01630 [Longimicrobiales bacterium]|nr:hypothetical protein [Longimicrobiales bacterium]
MDALSLEGIYGPKLAIDLCFACHLMWLDRRESIHLSPRATLDLFRVLHEHGDDARNALGSRLACPRCRRRLSLSHDIGKGGRFSYWSCPERHGRLTPFSEFLREKQFVRALSLVEQEKLKAEVKSVQCSSCGAPVDLTRGFRCGHCGSPISVLDGEAVERTLRELEEADRQRSGDPEEKLARARALAGMEALRSGWEPDRGRRVVGMPPTAVQDLLTASIRSIFGL